MVKAEEILAKIERGESVEYENVIVEGDRLDLSELKLPTNENDKFLITSSIKIRDSEFHGILNFNDAIFEKPVYFEGTKLLIVKVNEVRFCKYAGFEDTEFRSYADFSDTEFMGDANFTNVRFIEGVTANFDGSKFRENAFFWSKDKRNTIFGGDVLFRYAKFYKIADFSGAKFDRNADFKLTEFHKEYAQFMGTQFKGEINFEGSRFKGGALFRDSKFYGVANFRLVHFNGDAYFQNSMFIEGAQADFTEAKFDGDAMFVRSLFSGNINFTGVRFNKYLDFACTKFDKDLILNRARIDKMRFGAEFGYKANILLKDADFDQTKDIRWDGIKEHLDYEKNGNTIFLSLVENFKSLGFFDDADDCNYVYRDNMRKEKGKSNWSTFYDSISFLSCGYGVRPSYTLALILVVMYIFWIVFLGCSRSIFEAIYFSFTSLTGIYPIDLPIGAWKYAVMLESVLGYLFMALFVVVLARKLIR